MDPSTAGTPDSVLGRLLQELSWAGSSIRDYRQGGLGYENVLTAEALSGLDFLPRQAFLGSVLGSAEGADLARSRLIAEIEDAKITLLPDDIVLRPSNGSDQIVVQPDAVIESANCYALVEVKGVRRSSFQPEQLAREYVSVVREAGGRTPLLLLVLGEPPPVRVKGAGRLTLEDAVAAHLLGTLERVGKGGPHEAALMERLPDVLAWTTWQTIQRVVTSQHECFHSDDPSVARTVTRLVASVTHAIERHS